jgi:hypothetical protein
MARFGYRPEDAERLLIDAGFVCTRKEGDSWKPISGGVYASLSATELPPTGYNLLAIRKDALDEIFARLTAAPCLR